MRVEFLIVCHQDNATQEFLKDLITDALIGMDDEESSFDVQVTLVRKQKGIDFSVICGFTIEFIDELIEPNEAIQAIVTALKGNNERHVLKFYDDVMLKENLHYYQEIYTLEMRLRQALSLIYLSVCDDKYYDLLRDDQIQIASKDKPKETDLALAVENEFFHLLFSQYVQLNQRRRPTNVADILTLINDMQTYETFRDEITRQPVQDETDGGFLASLKELLDSIEKLRNCVAHNRSSSQRLRGNYIQAKSKLLESLDMFMKPFLPSE